MPATITPAQPQLAHLVTSLLSSPSLSPSSPIPDHLLLSIANIVGNQTLLDALDLIDRDKISRLTPPSARPIYLVASSSSSSSPSSYHVVPDVRVGGSAGGWCPCPAFARGVVGRTGEAVTCKHLLAVLLSLRLSSPAPSASSTTTTDASTTTSNNDEESKPASTGSTRSRSVFVEKKATLEWVAGWATKFGTVAVPVAAAAGGGG